MGIEIGLIPEYSSALLSKCHEIADIVIGRDHLDLGNRLGDVDIGSRIGEVFGIRYPDIGTRTTFPFDQLWSRSRIECALVSHDEDLVRHLRTRDDDVHTMLSPEPLFHDIEMEESEKSTAKSIAECG